MEDKLNIEEQEQLMLTEEQLQVLSELFQSNRVETTVAHAPAEFKIEPFELDSDEFDELQETKEFIEGKALGVKWGSMFSTLLNLGVDVKMAGDLTLNEQTIQHNQELQKIVNEGYKIQSNTLKQAGL